MIKKFIALSLAVLVMASHMVSAYALTANTTYNWTENGVTGEIGYILGNPNYKTFYASTSAEREFQTYGYIYARILLENADDKAFIKDNYADGHNLHLVQTTASVTYGHATRVRVTGFHKAGSSENDLRAEFAVRSIYTM